MEEARAAIEQRAEEQWARYAVLAEVAEMVEGRNPYGCNQGGHGKKCPKMGRRNNPKAPNVLVPNNRNARESGGKKPKEPFTNDEPTKQGQNRRRDRKNYVPVCNESLPDGTLRRVEKTVQDSSQKTHVLCQVKNVLAFNAADGGERRNISVLATSDSFAHIDRRHGLGNETNGKQIPLSPAHYENIVHTVRNPEKVKISEDDKSRWHGKRFIVRRKIQGILYTAIVEENTARRGMRIVTCWAEFKGSEQ